MPEEGTYIDHPGAVAVLEVVEDGRFMQVGQHGHILNSVKLRWVHGIHIIRFDSNCL